jgi:hypothetical protein
VKIHLDKNFCFLLALYKMRKIMTAFLLMVFAYGAHAAQISSVGHLHQTIQTATGVAVPIAPGIDPRSPHSLRYMYYVIDRANEILNGCRTSFEIERPINNLAFINNVVATSRVAQSLYMIRTTANQPGFYVTVSNAAEFSFNIYAAGCFRIDWGDGFIQYIDRPNAESGGVGVASLGGNVSRTFAGGAIPSRTIRISGAATEYVMATGANNTSISFSREFLGPSPQMGPNGQHARISGISGSLGRIFPRVSTATNGMPSFAGLFSIFSPFYYENGDFLASFGMAMGWDYRYDNTCYFFDCCTPFDWPTSNGPCNTDDLVNFQIPGELFAGLYGPPVPGMFRDLFGGASGVSGPIPASLFFGIRGPAAARMFANIFNVTRGDVSWSIPAPSDLFAGVECSPYANTASAFFHMFTSPLTGMQWPNQQGNSFVIMPNC